MPSTMREPVRRILSRILSRILVVAALAAAGLATAGPSPIEMQARALQRAHDAVVGVHVQAVDDARSASSLGHEREGSGIVIGRDGLVLTIGYLILEADAVQLQLDLDRVVPARVVAYDVATGLGLVQALAPLPIEPVALGDAASLKPEEPLVVASGGADGAVSMARVVSQRPFSGYWEYHLDRALFTSPARTDHPGAALINPRGELVGVGSLLVLDALGRDAPKLPGNMFVPVDVLKPVLDELRTRGHSRQSERAWIGLHCVEADGELRVLRVTEESPASEAGIEPGDRIVRIDGVEVGRLDAFYKALWTGAAEREVALEIEREGRPRSVTLHAVDRATTFRRARGI